MNNALEHAEFSRQTWLESIEVLKQKDACDHELAMAELIADNWGTPWAEQVYQKLVALHERELKAAEKHRDGAAERLRDAAQRLRSNGMSGIADLLDQVVDAASADIAARRNAPEDPKMN